VSSSFRAGVRCGRWGPSLGCGCYWALSGTTVGGRRSAVVGGSFVLTLGGGVV